MVELVVTETMVSPSFLPIAVSSILMILSSYGIYHHYHHKNDQDLMPDSKGDVMDKDPLVIYKTYNISKETVAKIPSSFDARDNWTKCPSIGRVWDQGSCASCWAIASTSVMTDRLCIESGGSIQAILSPQYLISCCEQCTELNSHQGCNGGNSEEAWKFWVKNGIVTGGGYNTNETCLPYLIEPCHHETSDAHDSLKFCEMNVETPSCPVKCVNSNNTLDQELKYYGTEYYYLHNNETEIQYEIMTKGPVEGKFYFDDSFAMYDHNTKNGLIDCKKQSSDNVHSIKIIGWGEDNNKVRYWLCINSYNSDWGDNGLFKIERGKNKCQIEEAVIAGIPYINGTYVNATTDISSISIPTEKITTAPS